MSVRPAHRAFATVVVGAILGVVALVSGPSAASATTAASDHDSARATGSYRITVHGWTRTIQRGDQSTIDHCRSATLWAGPLPGGRGTTWLAGHDHCGFYRWDRDLHVGDHFRVTTPSGGVLRYRVTGRGYVGRHGGSAAGLIHGDITLQTCHGSGTAFTYAQLIGH